jgi:signal transduction histidine kinase
MNTDLALLSQELINERTDERRDISRFIHDGISQHLVALSFTISSPPGEPSGLPDLIEQCCRDIRVISCMLTPPPRGYATVAATIESYAGWLREEAGLAISVKCDPRVGRVAPEAESLLLAAVQEWTIRSLLKRVKASLFITFRKDDFGIILVLKSIPDRAVAAVEEMKAMTDGWVAIRERVKAIGGRLEITADSGGALARMSLPKAGTP